MQGEAGEKAVAIKKGFIAVICSVLAKSPVRYFLVGGECEHMNEMTYSKNTISSDWQKREMGNSPCHSLLGILLESERSVVVQEVTYAKNSI
jgi:hypothetical protein